MSTNIQLVSFVVKGRFKNLKGLKGSKGKRIGKELKKALDLEIDPTNADSMIDIINNSTADIILFPGWSLDLGRDSNQIDRIKSKITNSHSVVFFSAINEEKAGGERYYIIERGQLTEREMKQRFTNSGDVSPCGVRNMLKEPRLVETSNSKMAFLLLCGEINILKYSRELKKASFRFDKEWELNHIFQDKHNEVNVILNPGHTPMGEAGAVNFKRSFLSEGDKIYCSTANLFFDKDKNPEVKFSEADIKRRLKDYKSLQYCYVDGKPLYTLKPRNIANRFMTQNFGIP